MLENRKGLEKERLGNEFNALLTVRCSFGAIPFRNCGFFSVGSMEEQSRVRFLKAWKKVIHIKKTPRIVGSGLNSVFIPSLIGFTLPLIFLGELN